MTGAVGFVGAYVTLQLPTAVVDPPLDELEVPVVDEVPPVVACCGSTVALGSVGSWLAAETHSPTIANVVIAAAAPLPNPFKFIRFACPV